MTTRAGGIPDDAATRGGAGPAGLTGVIPPLITPLTGDGELDVRSLERLVGHLLDGGVHGLFALGSTSEVAFFEDRLRDEVLDAVLGIVAGAVPVLVGVIDTQTRRVLDHVRRAERRGVAGVVATAPFYAITGPEEIRTHFRVLGERAQVPAYAYDLPQCVHTKLDAAMLVELGAERRIVGVKDSSGDDVGFRRLAERNAASGAGLTLLTGHETVVDGAYLAGAHGSVPGLGNVDPAGYVRMHAAAMAGEWAQVAAQQARLARLMAIAWAPVGKVGPAAGVGSFKTALQLLGIIETNAMSLPMSALAAAGPTAVLAAAVEAGRRALAAAAGVSSGASSVPRPAAVGVGSAGVIDPTTGIVRHATDALPGWSGTPLAAELSKALQSPTYALNDVHAHAIGEARYGMGRGHRDVLVVAVGTGVGGALIHDGDLLPGAHAVAGHLGHVESPDAAGLPCSCGRVGHLEALASGPGISAAFRRAQWGGLDGADPSHAPTAAEIAALAASTLPGHSAARDTLVKAGVALGRSLGGWLHRRPGYRRPHRWGRERGDDLVERRAGRDRAAGHRPGRRHPRRARDLRCGGGAAGCRGIRQAGPARRSTRSL